MIVAKIERVEKRLIPHMPWPLVQPLPIFVPRPTNKPPAIIRGIEEVILNTTSFLEKKIKTKGPRTSPMINNKFENLFSFFSKVLLTIPLIPASRPVVIKNKTMAKPMINPPMSDE